VNSHEPLKKDVMQDCNINGGLSDREAKRKLKEHGPNILTEKKKISMLRIFFQQFKDFMVLILIAATLVSAFMGDITEAITIIAIVVLNAVLGFVQEFRTEKTMEALKSLAAPAAKVVRNGKTVCLPAEQIVPGDVVVLEAGDRVPADATLLESNSMQVDESLLTGESVPVEKNPYRRSSKSSFVYMGTIVTGGRAKAQVHATGMNTEMGKIADLIQNIEEDQTPLQKKLAHMGKLIVAGCLTICAIVAVTGILHGEDAFDMLLAGISLAVAAVPEGLPAIVTIALALGVQRMLSRNALIRKLPAVETLGCASVICSDKTGTLTENKMTVRKIYAGESMIEIKGNENKEGYFYSGGRKIDPGKSSILRLALETGALCNNAEIVKLTAKNLNIMGKVRSVFTGQDNWETFGDPTEGALLVAAAKAGFTQDVLQDKHFRIDELPFDSYRKCMSVVCDNHRGEAFVFTKGAPDIIIKKCSRIHTSRGVIELNPALRAGIMKVNDSMASEALRVLGVALKRLDSRIYKREGLEKELIFIGLIGMMDPPRKEALDAVRRCKMAGIKTVMITGDHRITAQAIARELDICGRDGKVLTGAELEEMGEAGLLKVANDVSVYARVSPKHKLMIVRTLKKLGHIVAMTGDGVNDAPAVKEADIGVSMGVTGTDVTREASSMILLDDNFATIVDAIEEGRVIYNNIRKFIRYMLACNIGEVLTMFLGILIGLPIPLLPIQILWVNLVTDGLPAVALGFDPPGKDIMMQPPRGSKENIFSQGLSSLILFRGVLIGLTTLAVFISMLVLSRDINQARTGAFMTLVITQLIHVFECKSERKSIFEISVFNNMYLVVAVAISLAMILGVVYIPALQGIFKTVPLDINAWMIIGGLSFLGPVIASFFRFVRRR
jgi:Ca2+-transporting ATPase